MISCVLYTVTILSVLLYHHLPNRRSVRMYPALSKGHLPNIRKLGPSKHLQLTYILISFKSRPDPRWLCERPPVSIYQHQETHSVYSTMAHNFMTAGTVALSDTDRTTAEAPLFIPAEDIQLEFIPGALGALLGTYACGDEIKRCGCLAGVYLVPLRSHHLC